MEIKYEDITKVVRKLGLRDYTFFQCGGLDHCLVYEDPDNGGTPAWYTYPSQQVDGADIILFNTIPRIFRKPIILHEVAEVLLRKPDYESGEFEFEMEQAHPTAKQWDERFAKETLDDKTFAEYLAYKSRFSKFLGQH